jgi:hypothetical protein
VKKYTTTRLLIGGLALLALTATWWLVANAPSLGAGGALVLGAVFPALLLRMVIRRTRNWSGVTALVMIPYSVIGIMEVIATLGEINSGLLLALVAIANFILALDAGRRTA